MQESIMELLWSTSHFSGGNAPYVEDLYESYLKDPNSVPENWREMFDKLPRVNGSVVSDVPHSEIISYFESLGRNHTRLSLKPGEGSSSITHERKQVEVVQLVNAYRLSGHQKASTDPLGLHKKHDAPDLDLAFHGLNTADLDSVFQTGDLGFGYPEGLLKNIIADLETTYCGSIGS